MQYIHFYRKLITIIFSYRKLNFARCYTADISSIKYFLKPEICENVKELDLTSCYWLRSVDVRRCVLKLLNLEALYVADTSLSIGDVIRILKKLHQVLIVATLFLGIVTLSLRFIVSINLGYLTLRMSCSSNCRSKNKGND
jgi:Excinuclease ATPase subunit